MLRAERFRWIAACWMPAFAGMMTRRAEENSSLMTRVREDEYGGGFCRPGMIARNALCHCESIRSDLEQYRVLARVKFQTGAPRQSLRQLTRWRIKLGPCRRKGGRYWARMAPLMQARPRRAPCSRLFISVTDAQHGF